MASRRGLHQGDRPESRRRRGSADLLPRELRLAAHAPPFGAGSGPCAGGGGIRLEVQSTLESLEGEDLGRTADARYWFAGGIYHRTLLGLRGAKRGRLRGISSGTPALAGAAGDRGRV